MKRTLTCLLLAVCCLLLIACGRPPDNPSHRPQRIVSLNLDADEILLDLVAPERIVAVTELVDKPEMSYSVDKARAVSQRVQAYTIEEILSLRPDLLIVSEWMDEGQRRTLTDMGITVHTYRTATTLAEIPTVIRGMAAACGESARGEELIAAYRAECDTVLAAAAAVPAPARPRLFLWAYRSPYGAGDMLFGDMVRHLGVTNTLDAYTQAELASFPEEALITAAPDLILLTRWHFADESASELARHFTDDPAWSTVPAVANDRFAVVPGRALFCPNHYAAQGLRELYAAIYPDRPLP